jgi:hypothetical protein
MDGLNTPKFITNESTRDLRRKTKVMSSGKEHQKVVSRAFSPGKEEYNKAHSLKM